MQHKAVIGKDGMEEENLALFGVDDNEAAISELIDVIYSGNDKELQTLADEYIGEQQRKRDAKQLHNLSVQYLARFRKN